jgi:two-component system, cell cycle sensor histidine kinase PleC
LSSPGPLSRQIIDLLSDRSLHVLFPRQMDGAPDRAGAIALARAQAFIHQTGINLPVNICALVIVTISLAGHVPTVGLAAWLMPMTIAISLMQWKLWRGRGDELTVGRAELLLQRSWVWASLHGLMWGEACLFIPYLDWEQQIVLIVVATGLCTGSAASLAASPAAARAFMLGIGLPFIAMFVFQFSVPHMLLAVLALLLLIAMSLTTRLAYNALIEGIHAQFSARAVATALETAQQQWRELSETAEAFALYDSMHRLQLWNDSYARLLDLQPADLARFMNWSRIWQLAAYRRLPEAAVLSVDETLAPRLWTEEISLGANWYRSTVRRLANGHVAVSHVDITALKAREAELLDLQAELEDARDHAEQASSAKSRFLANMSHELRTPLNAVIGFSDLMLHQMRKMAPAPGNAHASYAQTIHDSGYHLLTIVEDMLDLARIEAGKMNFVESETDLIELVQAAADLAVGRNIDCRSRIVMSLPETPLKMRIDTQLTRQALINLIGNALKFTRSGKSSEEGRVFVTLVRSSIGDVQLSVRDEGIGIPAHLIDEVLKPFAQVEDSETRRFGGVGLGLPLAKQFIELQQGTLSLESQQGMGTTAKLVLPAWRVMSAETECLPLPQPRAA